MKLYRIFNGFMGNSWVRVEIIAENEEHALDLAEQAFINDDPGLPHYADRKRFRVEVLSEDTSLEWVSEVSDD